MDYAELLTRSWHIVWKNKVLWILGFVAGLAASGFRYNNNNTFSGLEEMSPETMTALSAAGLLIGCVAIIVGAAIWAVGTAARGGLIGSVWQLDEDDEMTLSVGEAFQPGLRAFWRIVGVNLVLYLPIWIVIIVAFGAIFALAGGMAVLSATFTDPENLMAGAGLAIFAFIALLCLLAPISFAIQLIQAFAVRGIVIRHLGIVESIKHGWDVVRSNIGEILLLGFLFVVISFVFRFALSIVMTPLAVLAMAPAMTSLFSGEQINALSGVWMVCAGFGIGIIGAALTSIITAWRSVAFTLAYKQFTGKYIETDMEPKFV